MKTRKKARSRHVEQRTCAILLCVIVSYVLFCFPACRFRVSGYGIRLACPGVWVVVCGCVRVCEKGGGTLVVSPPYEVWVRRRATLPHPSGCSTIAVPGLSFRVRNGSGRLPWAMAAANLQLSSHGFPWGIVWWVGDRIVDATEGLIHVTCRVSPRRPLSMFALATPHGAGV